MTVKLRQQLGNVTLRAYLQLKRTGMPTIA
jgi:hypothetical protein